MINNAIANVTIATDIKIEPFAKSRNVPFSVPTSFARPTIPSSKIPNVTKAAAAPAADIAGMSIFCPKKSPEIPSVNNADAIHNETANTPNAADIISEASANSIKFFFSPFKFLANTTIPIVNAVNANKPITAAPQSTKLKIKVAPAKASKAAPRAAIPLIPSRSPLKKPEMPPFLSFFSSLFESTFAKTAPSVAYSYGKDFKSSSFVLSETLPFFFFFSLLSTAVVSSNTFISDNISLMLSDKDCPSSSLCEDCSKLSTSFDNVSANQPLSPTSTAMSET